MQGGCYRFHMFLKVVFPNAVALIHNEGDHIVSKIGNDLYDIKGKVEKGDHELYSPLTEIYRWEAERWSFHKNNMLKLKTCPDCDFPIGV